MPITSKDQKEDILDLLIHTKRKSQKLELRLRMLKQQAEAKKVETARKKLSKKIDKLTVAAMRSWKGSAASTKTKVEKGNKDLQRSINSIKKKIKIAENVVKVVGYIDDAAKLAAKLLV